MGAKTGLVQPPAWAWSCPLPAQSARTQKARGGCTQQSQGQGGGTLLGSLLPAPLTISTADFPTFPPWEHLAVCFGSKPDLRASGSAVLGKTPSSSCAQQCPHPVSAPRVCTPCLRPAEGAGAAPGSPPWPLSSLPGALPGTLGTPFEGLAVFRTASFPLSFASLGTKTEL